MRKRKRKNERREEKEKGKGGQGRERVWVNEGSQSRMCMKEPNHQHSLRSTERDMTL